MRQFSFSTKMAKVAGKKPVRRPFDQVLLDTIVQACKLDVAQEEKVFARRRTPPAKMVPDESTPHSNCRRDTYPDYPKRVRVEDGMLSWDTKMIPYPAKDHCDEKSRAFAREIGDEFSESNYADPWREDDGTLHPALTAELLDRTTFCTTPEFCSTPIASSLRDAVHLNAVRFDATGRPLNPRGRTGLTGRGLLPRWGPNHAADPIVTRFSPIDRKLQFAAIQRDDMDEWAIPGGMVGINPGDRVPNRTLTMFEGAEPLRSGRASNYEGRQSEDEAATLFQEENGTVIYCGYVDDPRNTDNAWLETMAVHFHCTDEQAKVFHSLSSKNFRKAIWMDIDSDHESRYANLYASHRSWVDRVACMMYGHRADRPVPVDYDQSRCDTYPILEYKYPITEERMLVSPWAASTAAASKYEPTSFTHSLVLEEPPWCDPDKISKQTLHERLTFEGPIAFDATGRPLNPRGRTGLAGRGLLGRWGPNHAADLLLTRDHPVTRKLQIVIIKRQDATAALKNAMREDDKSVDGEDRCVKAKRSLFPGKSKCKLTATSESSSPQRHIALDERRMREPRAPATPPLPAAAKQGSGASMASDTSLRSSSDAMWGKLRQRQAVASAFREMLSHPREALVKEKTKTWAFPGLLFPDEYPEHLKEQRLGAASRGLKEVSEPLVDALMPKLIDNFEAEAFNHDKEEGDDDRFHQISMIESRLKKLSSQGAATTIYAGYVDDPRSTDNAWIETVAIHVHCPFDLGSNLLLEAGKGVEEATWIDVDHLQESKTPLYASHSDWLERVSTRMARREVGLSSILVRWGRLDVAERVLKDQGLSEHRQILMMQPALQEAVRRASSERNFNAQLLELLLNHGCTLSACSLSDILHKSREDPFLLLEDMKRSRKKWHDRNERLLAELQDKFDQDQDRKMSPQGTPRSPKSPQVKRRISLGASVEGRPTPKSIGLPEYSKVLDPRQLSTQQILPSCMASLVDRTVPPFPLVALLTLLTAFWMRRPHRRGLAVA